MYLVDVDVIGAQPPQRIIELLHDSRAGRISIDLAVAPLQSHLGGDDDFVAPTLDGCPDDLLGNAEATRRRGIDQIDALMQGSLNGGNRFALIGSAPHPT